MKVPPIIPITELRQDAAAVLNQVRESNQPFVVTQRGRAAAVILNIETYDRWERDRELLLLLARGDREVAGGKGYSLDSVMAEADRLLENG